MTERAPRERRDPLARKKARHTPPSARSRAMHAMSARAAMGRFVLQVCTKCGTATYPPRDACPACWGELVWQDCKSGGQLLANTIIHATTDLYFRDHLPWRMGTVALDAGPVALVHLHRDLAPEDRVEVRLMLDRGGNAALFALPPDRGFDMTDPQLREFIVPVQGKTVLVTDAHSAIGLAVVKALHDTGAGLIVAGMLPPARLADADHPVLRLLGVQVVPLDSSDQVSLSEALSKIGGPLDIVINTARHVRSGGVSGGTNIVEQRRAFEVAAIGLTRLAQSCGPMLAGRPHGAFVDVISSDALTGSAGHAGFAAAEAARLSLLQAFRHEMRETGVRVLSVFTGPVEDEHHQSVPPPKVAPARLATAIIEALQQGREQTCVGDVASDAMTRWLADPALYAREKNL
ncbi:MAG: SDR family NAD(P)-dependent oxidoreductase [Alphaproteobacteria bacterium]|nr:SDR family NAD(P)-dependent oxidoreductase [Alphaproteobacteria bacterium]MBU0795231.1 SDR family NAD(P)-dependent oxidoreductase [Alphaproteobacteria bacterium]MBU0876673.1 SDR family NAD(P)-dependent oxidoreductase [Alphaproteobacteria bacterium]MBU1769375.1 SDR family NAD(P)-dependent oxidoreductase [Alphaproteobacteria bacterium]